MTITRTLWTKLGVLAAIAAASGSAQAMLSPDIFVQKALNTPTFTVSYKGVAAAMVELRINGTSIGSRNVSTSRTSGEVVFNIDLTALNDGENDVEVRLFDKSGKLLETQRSVIVAGDEMPSPVKMSAPRMGSTVQGPVEIKVGFGKELGDVYVSFFVNSQFKSMSNVAPFSFVWDTNKEANGWHELEAWVVDSNSYTYKTRKVRVFVNNPGGRTNRVNTTAVNAATTAATAKPPVLNPSTPKVNPVTSGASGLKMPKIQNAATAVNATAATAPAITPNLTLSTNAIKAVTSNAVGLKAPQAQPMTTGAKVVLPKIESKPIPTRLDISANALKLNANGMVTISKGQRLPNLSALTVLMNSKVVNFDVQPRVQDGVPIAPLRHLIEESGGKVDWDHLSKTLSADASGRNITVRIGDKVAKINDIQVEMEIASFIEKGRTIVPLSFVSEALQVDVEYDPKTGHVLITSVKSKK
jgi:hypothetical protein